MKPTILLGLMSGTSADGVDAALVELQGHGRETQWRLIRHHQHPMPAPLREAVRALSTGRPVDAIPDPSPAAQVALVDAWIAEVFAGAARDCLCQAKLDAGAVRCIASHGQTVCHLPGGILVDGINLRATLQLGSGAMIAARTGIRVLCDFRTADLALGGQGAPLAPYADWVLFSEPGRVRVVQNLGGIGNLAYLPGIELKDVIAFDTGPANMLADAAVRRLTGGAVEFDRDGTMARAGKVSEELLKWLMRHPFLSQPPPRSTGHEDFGEEYLEKVLARAAGLGLSDPEVVATLTAVGPEAAVDAYRRFLPSFPDEIILGGGGSLNPVVVAHFERLCHPARVLRHEDFGIPAQAKEALAFAILANETLQGHPSNVPSATGASGPAVLGCFYSSPGRIPGPVEESP